MKQQGHNIAPLGLPSPPVSGWECVSEDNHRKISATIPKVTQEIIHEVTFVFILPYFTCMDGIYLPCSGCRS